METETVKEFADSLKKCVVSVGGGLPVRKENREILKNIGTVVYLKASEEELCKRLSRDNTRPLLKGGNLKEKIQKMFLLDICMKRLCHKKCDNTQCIQRFLRALSQD